MPCMVYVDMLWSCVVSCRLGWSTGRERGGGGVIYVVSNALGTFLCLCHTVVMCYVLSVRVVDWEGERGGGRGGGVIYVVSKALGTFLCVMLWTCVVSCRLDRYHTAFV